MTFTKSISGDKFTLATQGMIDTANAPAFEAEVQDAISKTKILELDFAQVEYISSSGLRVLLNAHKQKAANGKLVLSNVNEAVMDVFKMTGFSKVLTII